METSQPLAIESFSYSWLLNVKPSLNHLDELLRSSSSMDHYCYDEATSKKIIDHKIVNILKEERRYLEEEAQNFNFDTPPMMISHESSSSSSSSSSMSSLFYYADELFSNGVIKPNIHVDYSSNYAHTKTLMPIISSSISSRTTSSCSFLGKWRKFSWKKIMQRFVVGMIRPAALCQKVEVSRKKSTTRVDSDYYWCSDMESPIYEAVLHCKRSNGMENEIRDRRERASRNSWHGK